MQSFIMNPRDIVIHIHQGCFAGTGAIVRLPQCQWSKPDGYGKTIQCITTRKHSKAKTVCIFLGIYCSLTVMSTASQWICKLCGINIIKCHTATMLTRAGHGARYQYNVIRTQFQIKWQLMRILGYVLAFATQLVDRRCNCSQCPWVVMSILRKRPI